jgi:hypothetical protein
LIKARQPRWWLGLSKINGSPLFFIMNSTQLGVDLVWICTIKFRNVHNYTKGRSLRSRRMELCMSISSRRKLHKKKSSKHENLTSCPRTTTSCWQQEWDGWKWILDYEEKKSSYLQKRSPFTRMVNPTTNSNTLSLHLSMKMVTMRIELQLNNHK